MAVERNEQRFPIDDLGAIAIVMTCLALIGLKRETAAVTSVLLTVVGFMFGKYTRKGRR